MSSALAHKCPTGTLKLLIDCLLKPCVYLLVWFKLWPSSDPTLSLHWSAARWWRRCYETRPWPTSPTTRAATRSTWRRGRGTSTSSSCSSTRGRPTPDSTSRSGSEVSLLLVFSDLTNAVLVLDFQTHLLADNIISCEKMFRARDPVQTSC